MGWKSHQGGGARREGGKGATGEKVHLLCTKEETLGERKMLFQLLGDGYTTAPCFISEIWGTFPDSEYVGKCAKQFSGRKQTRLGLRGRCPDNSTAETPTPSPLLLLCFWTLLQSSETPSLSHPIIFHYKQPLHFSWPIRSSHGEASLPDWLCCPDVTEGKLKSP